MKNLFKSKDGKSVLMTVVLQRDSVTRLLGEIYENQLTRKDGAICIGAVVSLRYDDGSTVKLQSDGLEPRQAFEMASLAAHEVWYEYGA